MATWYVAVALPSGLSERLTSTNSQSIALEAVAIDMTTRIASHFFTTHIFYHIPATRQVSILFHLFAIQRLTDNEALRAEARSFLAESAVLSAEVLTKEEAEFTFIPQTHSPGSSAKEDKQFNRSYRIDSAGSSFFTPSSTGIMSGMPPVVRIRSSRSFFNCWIILWLAGSSIRFLFSPGSFFKS
jgi:hypothetical protein